MSSTKPAFHTVADLGLRDVGIRNEPRRLAAQFGKTYTAAVALTVFSLFAICVIFGVVGKSAWLAVAFMLALTTGVLALALHGVRRSPMVVMKVTAEGSNRVIWLVIAACLLVALSAVLVGGLLVIPIVVLMAIMALLVWRGRDRVPEALRKLRSLLAAEELALGDGLGLSPGARRWRNGFRLVVATDRRVLVAGSPRAPQPFVLVDVPYARVTRFGINWTQLGRAGVLADRVRRRRCASSRLTASPSRPANLLSIARALRSHGVQADDPATLDEAERVWEETLRRGESLRFHENARPAAR